MLRNAITADTTMATAATIVAITSRLENWNANCLLRMDPAAIVHVSTVVHHVVLWIIHTNNLVTDVPSRYSIRAFTPKMVMVSKAIC